jgi:hypothetical protein
LELFGDVMLSIETGVGSSGMTLPFAPRGMIPGSTNADSHRDIIVLNRKNPDTGTRIEE